ncbi:MAG: fibronectin type III domain-containing protein, partial [Schleiferiaceae bacterium]|nr:fibronectin type III domain-containing protein [Schleiferiaceae bacterium]
ANFNSFSDFAGFIECGGITGPVIINVQPGSGPYNEQVFFESIGGTSAINTITINGNGETLSFANATTADRGVLNIRNSNYITVDNLQIDALGSTAGWAVYMSQGSSHNTISNCIINVNNTLINTNFAGVVMGNGNTAIAAAGGFPEFNTIENNVINGGYYSITVIGNNNASRAMGNVVRNNTFNNFYFYGIYSRAQEDFEYSGNEFSRLTRTTLSSFYALYFINEHHGGEIFNNSIHDPFGSVTNTSVIYALYSTGASATAAKPTLVYNNIFYNLENNGTLYAIWNATSSHWKYYHNTVDIRDLNPTAALTRAFYLSGNSDGVDIINNIASVSRSGTSEKHCIYILGSGTRTINNNGYFMDFAATNSAHVGYDGANRTTFSDWVANTNGWDNNAVFDNPDFLNPATGALTPASGAMNDLGQNLLSIVPTDFLDSARTTTPDPGAFEFDPPLCPRPSANVASRTDTNVVVSWTSGIAGGTYEIEWGPAGFTRGTGNFLTVTGDSLNVTGLAANTCYDIYIRLNCTGSGNGFSLWSFVFTFCTDCSVFQAPYTQGFETWSVGALPGALASCYSYFGSNASYVWEIGDGPSPFPATTGPLQGANNSQKYAFIRANGLLNSEAILFLPPVNTSTLSNPELRFFYHIFGLNLNELRAEVFNDSTQVWDVVFTADQAVQTAQADPFEEAIVPLINYKSGETQVRFVGVRGNGTSGQYAIDDISIAEAPPCPTPLDLDSAAITSTSVTLSWIQTGTPDTWDVEWGPVGFLQGTPGASTISATTNPYTLSNLAPGECYDIYVRANCVPSGNGVSANWAGPLEICLPFDHDIALEALMSPVDPIGCGDSTMPVTVVLYNNGINPESNIPISAILGGDFPATLNFTYSGPLAPDNFDTVVIGNVNTYAGGNITVNVTANLATDQNSANNNFTSGNITIAPGAPDFVPFTVCAAVDSVDLFPVVIPGLTYNWYNAFTDTVPFFTGDTFRVATTNPGPYYLDYGAGTSGVEDSLEFTFAAGNGQSGNMFDVNVINALEVTGFTVSPNGAGSGEFEVWHRVGTYNGFENSSAGWTLVEAINIGAIPAAGQYRLNFTNPYPLTTGIHAFYVTRVTGSVAYTNGTVAGALMNANADLEVFEGVGKVHPFGGTFNPRNFNGRIIYQLPGGACTGDRIPVSFTVNSDTAVADFVFTQTGPGDFSFDATASQGQQFDWDFGDLNTGSGITTSHSYANAGSFVVTLVVTDTDCGTTDTMTVTVQSTISVEEWLIQQSLRVFPNPSTSQFNIEFEMEGVREMYLRVLSPTGQLILEDNAGRTGGVYRKTLDLGAYAKGVYILQIQTENGIVSRRLSLM